MLTATETIALGAVAYVMIGMLAGVLFERHAERADYPQPGEYELVRFFTAVLWPLWALRLLRERQIARRSEQERPPE